VRVWRFVLLLIVVAVGSYYAARFLLEGFPRRQHHDDVYVRPYGPDDDDDFLEGISRKKGPEDTP
jgi:hypothetical protein